MVREAGLDLGELKVQKLIVWNSEGTNKIT